MALVTKDFSINITPGEMPPIIHVSEYDIGRAFNVTLIGENRNAFEIPTGTTATIEGTLNGTVGFTQSATVSNSQVSFTLSESMTAYSGKAWCKIKLMQNSQPIQTCAFVLAVDRAGVEAGTVIGAPGFEEQIQDAVDDWLDEHGGGSGLTDSIKSALLACFQNVAWITSQGQTYYQALYDALYPAAPPAILSSITAAFSQGGHTVYDTDSLDSLKPYLTVTAHYSNGTSQTVTAYTLSGTLAEGTSVVTVSYDGKTTTFNVDVTVAPPENLFDPSTASNVLGAINVSNSKLQIGSQAQNKITWLAVSPNTSYRVTKNAGRCFRIATTATAPQNNTAIISTTADHTATEITLTTESNAAYLVIQYWGDGLDTISADDLFNSIGVYVA